MNDLEKELCTQLQKDLQVEVKHSEQWNLPVQRLKVDFDTVEQSTMDVLMKMLLTAFQTASFQNSEQLSETLLVEPLFIEHVIQKMSRANLVKNEAQSFMLTEKGEAQLASGIFIDLSEERTENLLYSPCHNKILLGDETDSDEALADYRYYDEYANWTVETLDPKMIQAILQTQMSQEDANVQMVVSRVHSIAPLTMAFIPCIEFQIYNQAEDIFYARIWNTLLGEWDERLEEQVNERERQGWRELFLQTTK